MIEQPVNFYLDKHCIEIVDRLEDISDKLRKIASEFKRAEITLEEGEKEEKFQKIKADVRNNRK
jgi:hypothetical protein